MSVGFLHINPDGTISVVTDDGVSPPVALRPIDPGTIARLFTGETYECWVDPFPHNRER